MCYSLVVYSVPLAQLRAAFGSKDDALRRAVEEREGEFLDEIDEIYEHNWDDEDGGEPLTARRALAQVVNGEELATYPEGLYVFVVEALCRYLGEGVDDRAFQPPIHWDYVEQVDDFLRGAGFPLEVAELAAGGGPVPVPFVALPSLGWWPPEAFPAAPASCRLRTPAGGAAGVPTPPGARRRPSTWRRCPACWPS
jgi:hypothetical protein